MKLRPRLARLERQAVPAIPALLFLTVDGLRDVHSQLVAHAPKGAKVIVGVDPSAV